MGEKRWKQRNRRGREKERRGTERVVFQQRVMTHRLSPDTRLVDQGLRRLFSPPSEWRQTLCCPSVFLARLQPACFWPVQRALWDWREGDGGYNGVYNYGTTDQHLRSVLTLLQVRLLSPRTPQFSIFVARLSVSLLSCFFLSYRENLAHFTLWNYSIHIQNGKTQLFVSDSWTWKSWCLKRPTRNSDPGLDITLNIFFG